MKIYDLVEELKFRKNYNTFNDFMDDCRERIYCRLYIVLEEMYLAGKKDGSLVVHATIKEVTYDKVYRISASDTSILTGELVEYFEEKEEYETCAKIVAMCRAIEKP